MKVELELGKFHIFTINTKFPLVKSYVHVTDRYKPKGTLSCSCKQWIDRLEHGDPRNSKGQFLPLKKRGIKIA